MTIDQRIAELSALPSAPEEDYAVGVKPFRQYVKECIVILKDARSRGLTHEEWEAETGGLLGLVARSCLSDAEFHELVTGSPAPAIDKQD